MTAGWRRAAATAALLAAVALCALLVPARGAHPTITRAAAPAADPNVRADITLCSLLLLCTPTPIPVTPTPTPPTIPINPATPVAIPPTATPSPTPTTAGAPTDTSTLTAPADTSATPAQPLGPFITTTSSSGSSSRAAGDTLNTAAPAAAVPAGDAFGASGLVTVVITILALTAVGAGILFWRLR